MPATASTPGVHVAPVLTADATRFVGEVTFSALASEPAQTSACGTSATPIPHTRLGQAADLVVVAPATAHFLGALRRRAWPTTCSTATLLATRAPVLVCPAMHTEMWEHPAVQENLATLRRRGVLGGRARGRAAWPAATSARAAWPSPAAIVEPWPLGDARAATAGPLAGPPGAS